MADRETAASVADLKPRVRGRVVSRDDSDYDTSRAVYNGMIDRRPAAIARCRDVADVMTAVQYARDHDLVVAVRGGGRNGAGFGSVDDGIVIDLGDMHGVTVDPEAARIKRSYDQHNVFHVNQNIRPGTATSAA